LTIDGIINEWTMQLERDIEEYARQSDKVAMWDNQLRENQKLLNSLMDSVHRILVDQEDLDGSIQAIEVRLAQNAVVMSDIDTSSF
jgi:primosomal protein N''